MHATSYDRHNLHKQILIIQIYTLPVNTRTQWQTDMLDQLHYFFDTKGNPINSSTHPPLEMLKRASCNHTISGITHNNLNSIGSKITLRHIFCIARFNTVSHTIWHATATRITRGKPRHHFCKVSKWSVGNTAHRCNENIYPNIPFGGDRISFKIMIFYDLNMILK